jgi:hypothetical protein
VGGTFARDSCNAAPEPNTLTRQSASMDHSDAHRADALAIAQHTYPCKRWTATRHLAWRSRSKGVPRPAGSERPTPPNREKPLWLGLCAHVLPIDHQANTQLTNVINPLLGSCSASTVLSVSRIHHCLLPPLDGHHEAVLHVKYDGQLGLDDVPRHALHLEVL